MVGRGVLACLSIQLATWILGSVLARELPFDRSNYFGNFGHYVLDARVGQLPPRFFELWNYSDSEWYLSIASGGYPDIASPGCVSRPDLPGWSTESHCSHKYAFFPLYPLLIAAFASFLPLLVAAFVATTLVGLAAAAAFVWTFSAVFPGRAQEGVVGVVLLFLFPFSVFYQLYFSEGLFLLLSLLTFSCLWRKHYLAMLVCGALLASTRALGVFIVIPLLVRVLGSPREPSAGANAGSERLRAGLCALLIPIGLFPWVYVNFRQTGDWRYFSTAQKLWGYENRAILANLWHNIVGSGAKFSHLAVHRFHSSQIDYVTMLMFAAVLVLMWRRRGFPKELAVWSTLLWLVPLATKDLMSFGRYMSVSFPVFMYLAIVPRRDVRLAIVMLFAIGYLVALGGIINYAWVG